MGNIHNTAIVHKTAILADSVEVGPYCLIGPDVKIASGTKLGPYCIVHKWTVIGKNNNFVSSCSIGGDPQDLKYKGEKTYLEIGDNNTVREYVTLNRGTGEGNKTIIGSNNLFMTLSHAGHNCIVGSNNVLANSAILGGHVVIEDNVVIGGLVGIHQFCRVGKLAIVGGCSKAIQDVPPFAMCDGNPTKVYGINKIGLQRSGMKKEVQALLSKAFKILFNKGLIISHAVRKIEKEFDQIPEIAHLIKFIKSSERGVSRG